MGKYLSTLFAQMGIMYPVLSPFIGVMGAYITGSTTVSNIIFGPVQYSAVAGAALVTALFGILLLLIG